MNIIYFKVLKHHKNAIKKQNIVMHARTQARGKVTKKPIFWNHGWLVKCSPPVFVSREKRKMQLAFLELQWLLRKDTFRAWDRDRNFRENI